MSPFLGASDRTYRTQPRPSELTSIWNWVLTLSSHSMLEEAGLSKVIRKRWQVWLYDCIWNYGRVDAGNRPTHSEGSLCNIWFHTIRTALSQSTLIFAHERMKSIWKFSRRMNSFYEWRRLKRMVYTILGVTDRCTGISVDRRPCMSRVMSCTFNNNSSLVIMSSEPKNNVEMGMVTAL